MRKRSKRARQIKALLLFGIVLVLVLILIVVTVGRQEFNAPHKFALELIGRAQSSVTMATNFFSTVRDDYVALLDVRDENKRLKEELKKFKTINNQYREAVATNVRLSKLLGFKQTMESPTLTATIVGKDPSLWFKTVIIDRGSSDGVQQGMPVVTEAGIVGQILSASPHYSKVLLTCDPNSAIDALIQSSRVQGIVKGQGSGYQLNYVLKNFAVREGDTIVTSGLGGIFPKGLPVGTVTKVTKSRRGMFQEIIIKPSVDFSQLEHLIIIMKENSLAE
ncbi:MAG: rod shape-determining protein MreC [Desulfobulbaceae bacterium]|nr:rod shape-determining protein MreC [Desulfobulbaceae bacterium]